MSTEFDRVNALLRRCEERIRELPYATVLDVTFNLVPSGDEYVLLRHGHLWICTGASGGEQRLPVLDAPFRLRAELLRQMGPFFARVKDVSERLVAQLDASIRDAERAIES